MRNKAQTDEQCPKSGILACVNSYKADLCECRGQKCPQKSNQSIPHHQQHCCVNLALATPFSFMLDSLFHGSQQDHFAPNQYNNSKQPCRLVIITCKLRTVAIKHDQPGAGDVQEIPHEGSIKTSVVEVTLANSVTISSLLLCMVRRVKYYFKALQ